MNTIDLGQIQLGPQIGEGGYGVVHEGRLVSIDHKVAVKLLHPSAFQSPRAGERFPQEAKILLSLRHPYIVSVHGLGTHEGKPYILMEHFHGMDLHKACERGRPSPLDVLDFLVMVSEALGYAHSQSIVHRDIKPSNLMTIHGDARVIDFGIAKIIDPDGERFTKSGGTPVGGSYAAPELLEDPRLIDPRTDIYSLGACWFWLLTGSSPHGRNWEMPLKSLEGVTPQYAAIVLKTLDQIDNRFQSMDELRSELLALKKGQKTVTHDEMFLDDDTLMILGVIFEQSEPDDEGVTLFALEKQIGTDLSRLRLKLSLQKLEKRNLVEFRQCQGGWNQEDYFGYVLLPEGNDWVAEHQDRIESLLQRLAPSAQPQQTQADDSDIPF